MVEAAGNGGAPRGKERGRRGNRAAGQEGRLAVGIGVIILALLSAAAWPAVTARADHSPYCYVVGNNTSNQRVLSRVTKSDGSEHTIGVLGTTKTDGIGMHPTTGVLYGVNTHMSTKVGVFGTINVSTGAFSAIGSGLTSSNNRANGSLGLQELYDASGFTFDPFTGILYGTQVRTGSSTSLDLLYQVNLATGRFVPDAFGSGIDYVVMPKLPGFDQFHDVDDIAIDPTNGQMYGIMNNSTDGDRLMMIDKHTGATSDVGGFGVGEVEGLDFDPHGVLWATAGGTAGTEANKLYEVNKSTGQASGPRLLDNAENYEALACMTGGLISSPTPTNTPTATSTQTGPPPTPDPSLTERLYLPLLFRH